MSVMALNVSIILDLELMTRKELIDKCSTGLRKGRTLTYRSVEATKIWK